MINIKKSFLNYITLAGGIFTWVSPSFQDSSGYSSRFNNAVVWLVPIFLLISNSSKLFSKPLATVQRIPATIGTTITLMFLGFLILWKNSSICSSFSFSFIFTSLSIETAKFLKDTILFLQINPSCSIYDYCEFFTGI